MTPAILASCKAGPCVNIIPATIRRHPIPHRSRLYRNQILQANIRWKARDEIYKIYMIAEAPLGALGSIMGETLGRDRPGKFCAPSHFLSVKSPKSSIY